MRMSELKSATSAVIFVKVKGDAHLMDVFARLNNGRREVCGRG
jgi:hypothetical protein